MLESYCKMSTSVVLSQKANITVSAVDMSEVWLRVVLTLINVITIIHSHTVTSFYCSNESVIIKFRIYSLQFLSTSPLFPSHLFIVIPLLGQLFI